ncbi:MAG: hypothetical protein WCS31_08150 [Verrucomicrobiae bacterium]
MKTTLTAIIGLLFGCHTAFAQIDTITRDKGLRQFFGIRSIGSIVSITEEYKTGYVTALLFKDGKFVQQLGDEQIVYSYGVTPLSIGKSALGTAPASVQAEFIWGRRGDSSGYIIRAACGNAGRSVDFTPLDGLSSINLTELDFNYPNERKTFDGFLVLGTAYEIVRKPNSEEISDMINASHQAIILLFQQFKTDKEAEIFIESVKKKYKNS